VERRRAKLWGLVLSIWLGASLTPWGVAAQPVGPEGKGPSLADKETARALFVLGDDKFQLGDYSGALDAFEAADEIMGVPTTKLERARTLAMLGRLLEAQDMLLKVSRMPVASDESEAFQSARAEAQTMSQDVAARIPSLRVRIQGLAEGADFDLRVDDAFVPSKAARFPRKVDPGSHLVVVSAKGYATQRQRTEVAERDSAEVVIDMAATQPSAEDDDGMSLPLLSWVGFGVGAAGLIVGSVTGGITLSRVSKLDDQCPDRNCPAAVQDDLDKAELISHVSTVGFVVAGAGVTLGVVGLLFGGASESDQAAAVEPWIGPGSAGLRGRF
jgi:hypothetical protein